jgi:hypothetical protein
LDIAYWIWIIAHGPISLERKVMKPRLSYMENPGKYEVATEVLSSAKRGWPGQQARP